jgi:ABC-2 type transport system permease protein
MRKYYALAQGMLQRTIVQRAEAWLGLVGGLFAMLAVYYVWRSVFSARSGSPLAGFDWQQIKAYLIISLAAMSLVTFDWTIVGQVRDGAIAFELVRPVDFQKARFAEGIGAAVFEVLTVAGLGVVIALLFGGVYLPQRPESGLLFAISFLLVIPLQFGVVYPFALMALWDLNYYGIQITRIALVSILSGAVIPLAFFPHWFQTLAAVLPFRGIVSTPASIYLERVGDEQALRLIAEQLGWAVILWVACRGVWHVVVRKVSIQGG